MSYNNFLITGATSALGKMLTKKISSEFGNNCKMLLISRSYSQELKELTSSSVIYLSGVDLLKLKPGDSASLQIDDFFNTQFSLIHSAGNFWDHLPFLNVATDEAREMMDSHYGTLYAVLQSVLPLMIKKGGGSILAYSCNAVNYNLPNMLPFNAAKAAVEATIKCIAHEYSKQNIVANVLALSSLQTEAVKKSKPHGDYEHFLPLNEICATTLDILNLNNNLVNASVINCYKYSDSYYNEGYFERIKK